MRKFVTGDADYFIPPTPQLFFSHQCEFDFKSTYVEPQVWMTFLTSLGQDKSWVSFLQQWMGYTLWLGLDLHKYLHLVGPKRGGKGILAGVIRDINGGPAAEASVELENLIDRFGLEDAITKRILTIPEMAMPDRKVHKIVAKLKAMTGGDAIGVDLKHKKMITVRPRLKIMMVTNEFVALPDNSGALHARLLPLRLTKSFFGQEDLQLAEKLSREYPDILLWALEGLKDLHQNGGRFTLPESSLQELEELAGASAPVQRFGEECCTVDVRRAVQCDALYQLFRDWFTTNYPGQHPLSDGEFQRELKAAVPTVRKDRLGAPNAVECKRAAVVETEYDRREGPRRPLAWVGIAPKPEFTKRDPFSLILSA